MSAMDANPSVLQLIFYKLTKAMARRTEARARAKNRTRAWFITFVRFLYAIAGFGCLTLAGFTISITVGLVIAGVSCFGLSFLTTGQTDDQQTPPEPRLR